MRFLAMLGRTVRQMDLPFGYTLTVWSSGFIAADRFGHPSLSDIFLFVAGALLAYLLCAALSFAELDEPVRVRLRAGAVMNIFAIVAAAVVSAVSRLLPTSSLGYPVAGFVGTFIYIICMSALLYLAHRRPQG